MDDDIETTQYNDNENYFNNNISAENDESFYPQAKYKKPGELLYYQIMFKRDKTEDPNEEMLVAKIKDPYKGIVTDWLPVDNIVNWEGGSSWENGGNPVSGELYIDPEGYKIPYKKIIK